MCVASDGIQRTPSLMQLLVLSLQNFSFVRKFSTGRPFPVSLRAFQRQECVPLVLKVCFVIMLVLRKTNVMFDVRILYAVGADRSAQFAAVIHQM
jgi:hypothetical protein